MVQTPGWLGARPCLPSHLLLAPSRTALQLPPTDSASLVDDVIKMRCSRLEGDVVVVLFQPKEKKKKPPAKLNISLLGFYLCRPCFLLALGSDRHPSTKLNFSRPTESTSDFTHQGCPRYTLPVFLRPF